MTNVKKQINIAKMITNSHKFHSETTHWSIMKKPWDRRFYHLYDIKRVENEKLFLLDFPFDTHIQSKF